MPGKHYENATHYIHLYYRRLCYIPRIRSLWCFSLPQGLIFKSVRQWLIASVSSLTFQIMLSHDARNTAWVSFDGRKRQEICHGDRSVRRQPTVADQNLEGSGDGE